jgi:hypothetical protein
MEMGALWDGLTQRGLIIDVVPFKDGDGVEVIGEHPRRHQSRDATADDDRPLTDVMRHAHSSIDRLRSSPSRTQA